MVFKILDHILKVSTDFVSIFGVIDMWWFPIIHVTFSMYPCKQYKVLVKNDMILGGGEGVGYLIRQTKFLIYNYLSFMSMAGTVAS